MWSVLAGRFKGPSRTVSTWAAGSSLTSSSAALLSGITIPCIWCCCAGAQVTSASASTKMAANVLMGPATTETTTGGRDKLRSPDLVPGRKNSQYFTQSLPHPLQFAGLARGKRQHRLRFIGSPGFHAKLLPRAGNGKAILIEQLADVQHVIHVPPPVHPLAGAALGRPQLWEFRF